MCLAIPSKVISIEKGTAMVDVFGAKREISLILMEDEVNVGDYVIVHAGFAIQKLQEEYAQETLELFKQYAQTLEESGH